MTRPLSAWAWVLASRLLMGAAARLLGPRQADWARAMQAEAATVGGGREALAFAWGCLWAALGHAVGHALAAARGGLAQPHRAGVLACAVTVLAGCVFMHRAGAPGHYAWMNLLSLALALATFRLLPRQRLQADALLRARLSFVLGALLLMASVGPQPADASAWLRVGPVALNLAWLLLPALLVASDVRPASTAGRWALGGLLMACGALALQADAVLLGLVAAALGARAGYRRSGVLALLALAAAALAAHQVAAWQAPQTVAFVDQLVDRGLEQSLATGLALGLLQALPLWPALRHRGARPHGLVWGLVVALSLPGWLPSPWVGFGGSFIGGYLLSLALVGGEAPERPATRSATQARPRATGGGRAPPPTARAGLT